MLTQKLNTLSVVTKLSLAPSIELRSGQYLLRFARNVMDLDAALKLRFEVFNLELGEGLQASFLTGRDSDEFDAQCHHLIVEEEETGNVIGTYRIQTSEMAAAGNGFYSAGEFNLSGLPHDVVLNSIELGRACIAPAHRHSNVLLLLWKGIAAYLAQQRKRYLFGCCSITSQSPADAREITRQLKFGGHFHEGFLVAPQPEFACETEVEELPEFSTAKIPKLFRTYLRLGAKVCGAPALDRAFKTIDYFVLLDCRDLNSAAMQMLFGV